MRPSSLEYRHAKRTVDLSNKHTHTHTHTHSHRLCVPQRQCQDSTVYQSYEKMNLYVWPCFPLAAVFLLFIEICIPSRTRQLVAMTVTSTDHIHDFIQRIIQLNSIMELYPAKLARSSVIFVHDRKMDV